MMKNNRIYWIDQLRAVALFFVIVGHVNLSSEKISLIYSFHMPLFFIISGLTLNDDKILNMRILQYIKDKSKKLLLPYIWMSFMMYPLWYITFHKLGSTKTTIFQALRGILYGNNVQYYSSTSNALWFLLVLFLAFILYMLIVKISREDECKQLICVTLCAIIGYLDRGVAQIWHFNVAFTAVVFLYIGKWIMRLYHVKHEWFENKKLLTKYIVIAICIVLGLFFHKCNGRISMTANKFGESLLLFYLTAITFSMAIILIIMMLPNINIINYIGKNTLLYVGVHIPVIRLFEKLYPSLGESELNCVILAITVYFGLGIVCQVFNSLFPYVCAKKISHQINKRVLFAGKIAVVFNCCVILMEGVSQKILTLTGYEIKEIFVILVTLLVSVIFVLITERLCPGIYCEE